MIPVRNDIYYRSRPGLGITKSNLLSLNDEAGLHPALTSFSDAWNAGTLVEIVISYHAPLGLLGEKAGRLLNPVFEKLVYEDVKNFKRYIETSDIPAEPAERSKKLFCTSESYSVFGAGDVCKIDGSE